MMYVYKNLKEDLFSDQGQIKFLTVRDNVQRLLKEAGAIRMSEAIRPVSGDSWLMLACVDRLVELGEIREITVNVAGQNRVFVR